MVRCRIPGRGVEAVHLADPGRLRELLVPGRRLLLRAADDPDRKTGWSAVLVQTPEGGGWVSVDTTLPNRLVERALRAGVLEELEGWRLERREWSHGNSRFDFLLTPRRSGEEADSEPGASRVRGAAAGGGASRGGASPERLVLEVKSVTLVEDGVALFPDAVTARGARHVRELAELARAENTEAAVLFVLQRPDAGRIHAAADIDPEFAAALQEAKAAGVRILGRRCTVKREAVTLGEAVPAG